RTSGSMLERNGKLPKPPSGFESALLMKNLKIEISNWACLEAMFRLAFDEKILEILSNMNASLVRTCDGCRFFTCDQPVALFNSKATPQDPYGVALVHPDTEVSVPLSHDLLLLLSWNTLAPQQTANASEVAEYNRRTVIMASKFLFVTQADESIAALLQANA